MADSFVRRAGSKILGLIRRTGDPAVPANRAILYAKVVGGVTSFFVREAAGSIFRLPGVRAQDEGVSTGVARSAINFIGATVTAADDAGNDRVNVTITAPSAVLTWGNDSVAAAADIRFLNPGSDSSTAGTSRDNSFAAPRAGTLRNLFARHNSPAGNGNSVAYTVLINGAGTALTLNLPTGAVGVDSDTLNTVAVAQGDQIDIEAAKALGIGAGGVDAMVSVEFT